MTSPMSLGLLVLACGGHYSEITLRTGVALRCSKPEQPPRLGIVHRPALAIVVHDAENTLRIGIALRCSEPKPTSLGLVVLACGAHGVPNTRASSLATLAQVLGVNQRTTPKRNRATARRSFVGGPTNRRRVQVLLLGVI